jgi:rhamnosyltransferase
LNTHSPDTPIKLSVVIRCRNEANSLRNALAALRAQKCDFAWEVVIVDNESNDDTRAICEEFGVRIVSIAAKEFSYGRAINMGFTAARGEFVMLLSAHALPVGSYFLVAAVEPFADPQVAAARCLMIGHNEQVHRWYKPDDIQYHSPEEQQKAESGRAWLGKYPTGGCAVMRRKVWEEIKYNEVLESNEDKLWAKQVLARGYKIRCCAEALWVYTRKYRRQEKWKRNNRQELSLYRITGQAPLGVPSYLWKLVRVVLSLPGFIVNHVVNQIVWNTLLVTIPWQAKAAPQKGSFAEFDQRH